MMMRKVLLATAVVVAASTVASVAAFGRNTAHDEQAATVTALRDLWVGLVGQYQNSAPGVTPVTHIHYGYLSYVQGAAAFRAIPHDETTALFTFFADGSTSSVIVDGPFRTFTRVGTLTIYRGPSANANFADPDSFRDGIPVLAARYRQHVMLNTVTNAVTAYHQDTIISAKPFDTGRGKIQLGTVGERFDEHYDGHNNMPGPPSGYFVGYAVSR